MGGGGGRGGAIILFEHVQGGGMGWGNHLFHTCRGGAGAGTQWQERLPFFQHIHGVARGGGNNLFHTCREVPGAGGNFIGILPGGGVGRWAKGPFSRGGKKYPNFFNKSFFDQYRCEITFL